MNCIVKPGDTLSTIAQTFSVPLSTIISANPQIKDPDLIYPGQVINIPDPSTPQPGQTTYVVQSGDTMYLIAQKYGVSLDALIKANPQIKDPSLIYPGEIINVPGPVTLAVFAAISLTNALNELKEVYVKEHPYVSIVYRFAASGDLQKAIEQGAPADIFISAAEAQMDALAAEGLIIASTRKDLVGNDLVLIAGKSSTITGFADLTGPAVTRVGIGDPATVPAGMYAEETLKRLDLWESVQPKLVFGENVRQVLNYVETGHVDAGLVYRSDALVGKGITTVATAPEWSHDPILYPVAVVKTSRHLEQARAFAAFLSGGEAVNVFSRYGFTTF